MQSSSPEDGVQVGKIISDVPYQQSTPLLPLRDEFVIVGCDGVWEKLSHKASVKLVGEGLRSGRSPAEVRRSDVAEAHALDAASAQVAQDLVERALSAGGMDNVSAIVVQLEWVKKPKKGRSKKRAKSRAVCEPTPAGASAADPGEVNEVEAVISTEGMIERERDEASQLLQNTKMEKENIESASAAGSGDSIKSHSTCCRGEEENDSSNSASSDLNNEGKNDRSNEDDAEDE